MTTEIQEEVLSQKDQLSERLEPAVGLLSFAERRAEGKARRDIVSRKSHAVWDPHCRQVDPVAILEQSNEGRIQELVPMRYGRMLKSPFAFFRGSAALMAADLARTPVTGMRVQACGDCHLLNFGAYATPERNLIVDINDFDETLPAPWEWDIKRLATSFVLACRANSFSAAVGSDAARAVAASYRKSMREFSQMRVMDVWYSKMELETFLSGIKDKGFNKAARIYVEKQKEKSIVDYFVPKMTVPDGSGRRFKDSPPLVYHSEEPREQEFMQVAQETFAAYKHNLSDATRFVLDRFELMDVAMKIVGIGSVGTYCAVMLLMAGEDDPLILQLKEARPSVLEPYAGKSIYDNHAHRVVAGQRLMQAYGDIFLGWVEGAAGSHRHFYLRQLKDMKMSFMPELWTQERTVEVARALGWVLARAHARSGDAAMISGYLGNKDVFDNAIADFAVSYADQTERDHQKLVEAIGSGRIEAYVER